MIKLTTFLMLCSCAVAQTSQTIMLSPQGEAALKALSGKRIKGVQIVSVIACGDRVLHGGTIYSEAIKAGFAPMPPIVAQAVLNNAVSHNWRFYAIEAFKVVSITAAGLGAGRIVSMSPELLSAMVLGHQIGDELAARSAERFPNPVPLLSALLNPSADLDLSKGCQSAFLLSLYGRGLQTRAVSISVN